MEILAAPMLVLVAIAARSDGRRGGMCHLRQAWREVVLLTLSKYC